MNHCIVELFQDLQLVLAHIANFVETRFSSDSGRMQLNLVAVDSNNVTLREPNFGVDVIEEKFKLVKQTKYVYIHTFISDYVYPLFYCHRIDAIE